MEPAMTPIALWPFIIELKKPSSRGWAKATATPTASPAPAPIATPVKTLDLPFTFTSRISRVDTKNHRLESRLSSSSLQPIFVARTSSLSRTHKSSPMTTLLFSRNNTTLLPLAWRHRGTCRRNVSTPTMRHRPTVSAVFVCPPARLFQHEHLACSNEVGNR